ncbi:chloride channel protein [Roseomonas sp. OT10]|uniref:chloride channel protein n=1 Tax=Roseomonas cutis TaxID=2897332 RepID=UPI001E58AA52|nr:chloride channel protein [Roseomonas sp. OT10]UFN49621.1 chloride channel protein [Roseomonas sp. OT10]
MSAEAGTAARPVRRETGRALRRLRLAIHPLRGAAALRGWFRRGELGLLLLGILVGAASGMLATLMGAAAHALQAPLFGSGAEHGLSTDRGTAPWMLVLMPVLGGLLLGVLNLGIARWRSKAPVDPIEANALHGGRMSLADSVVVGSQNIVSNGFGASVGLEAAYTQAGGSVASRLGLACGLRRGDLRVLVGCGAAGAIAAAFGAPLTGAFYAFELVIGTYAIPALAPVIASAVTATLVSGLLHEAEPLAVAGGIAEPDGVAYLLSLLLGLLCGGIAIALMRGMTVVESGLRRIVPWAMLRPAAGGLVVGLLALVTPGVLSAGHGLLHRVLATDMAVQTLLALLILKSVASAVSIGSGFRGGLFFASLLLGGLAGKSFALLAGLALPGVDPMLLAIVGMSAFGTAVVGAPLAMTFLALETTRDFAVAGAVLVAVIAAGTVVRRLFGYSFATWRFHLRGEAIRGPHDIGWLRDLTVGKMMRRDLRTVRSDMRLGAFRRDFPLGSTQRVAVVDEAGRYAGLVLVAEAQAAGPEVETVAALLRYRDRALLPAMNAREAMTLFEQAEAEALAVVDGAESRQVLGLLTEAHLLRRYGEELDKRRREEAGLL